MFGGDDAAREDGDRAYYNLPDVGWEAVDSELMAELRGLQRTLAAAIERAPAPGAAEGPPSPAQLAFRLFGVANQLWAAAAGEGQDLRQVITTLRTALAVCWDLYGQREAEGTSVAQHMRQLRERIEGFERDLADLQAESGGSDQGA